MEGLVKSIQNTLKETNHSEYCQAATNYTNNLFQFVRNYYYDIKKKKKGVDTNEDDGSHGDTQEDGVPDEAEKHVNDLNFDDELDRSPDLESESEKQDDHAENGVADQECNNQESETEEQNDDDDVDQLMATIPNENVTQIRPSPHVSDEETE